MNVSNNYYFTVAVAYGEGAYGNCAYDDQDCQTVAQGSGNTGGVGNPNTGLLQEPSFLIPAIALLAILIVAAEVFIRRLLRKRRQAKSIAS